METSAAAYGKTYPDATVPAESAFERLNNFTKTMMELENRLYVLADRLSGPVPTNNPSPEKGMGIVGGGGLIDGLARDTATLRDLTERAFTSINRIENRL